MFDSLGLFLILNYDGLKLLASVLVFLLVPNTVLVELVGLLFELLDLSVQLLKLSIRQSHHIVSSLHFLNKLNNV